MAQIWNFIHRRVEKIVGEGKNAGYQSPSYLGLMKVGIVSCSLKDTLWTKAAMVMQSFGS